MAGKGDPGNEPLIILGEASDLAHQRLTRERNVFLFGFLGMVVLNLIFRISFSFMDPYFAEQLLGFAAVMTLVCKTAFVYLVFRLSRFLGQPGWLIALYCVFTLLAVLYLVPLIGLLMEVKRTRRILDRSGG